MSATYPGERLVESFEELHTGMRVIVRPCWRCGKVHRGMILGLHRNIHGVNSLGIPDVAEIAWEVVPSFHGPARTAIRPPSVDEKTVYEQVDQTPEEKRWERKIKRPKPDKIGFTRFKAPNLEHLKLKVAVGPGWRQWSRR